MAFAICWALTSTSWGRASLGLVKIASSSHFNHLGQKQRMWEAWHPELIWFAFSFSPNYRTVERWSWKKLWKPFNPTQTFERGRKSTPKAGMSVLGPGRKSCGLCKSLRFSELESLPLSNVWVGLNGFHNFFQLQRSTVL